MKNFFIPAGIVFVVDRLTKYLILKADFQIIEILPVLNLVKVWNRGIAFGTLSTGPDYISILLLILTPLILLFILIIARKSSEMEKVFLAMIFGGGLGNWIDRLIFGAVLDFIDLHLGRFHWPAFNIADLAITLGIILLILTHVLKNPRK